MLKSEDPAGRGEFVMILNQKCSCKPLQGKAKDIMTVAYHLFSKCSNVIRIFRFKAAIFLKKECINGRASLKGESVCGVL